MWLVKVGQNEFWFSSYWAAKCGGILWVNLLRSSGVICYGPLELETITCFL